MNASKINVVLVSTSNHILNVPFPRLSCVFQEEQNNPNATIFRKYVKFMKPQLLLC